MRLHTPFNRYVLALVVSLLVVGGSAGQAQRNWVPGDYYGIPVKDKQHAFFDEFDDNRNRWDLGSIYLEERIQEGEYYCASLTSYTYVKHRPVSMNQSGNYEVEISMRYVKGSERSVLGLTFGRDVRGNEYSFFLNPRNPRSRFKISKYDRDQNVDFQSWQYFGNRYNKHAYNRLMVRKVADEWFFFINEELVYKMEGQALFGNGFGFTVGGNTAVEVDYLRVSEIRTVDNMGPQITLEQPISEGEGVMRFQDRRQIIKGKVYDVSGISSVTINGTPITVSPEGIFSASLRLHSEDIVNIEIRAKDRFENVSRRSFKMQYTPAPVKNPTYTQATPSSQPAPSRYQQTASQLNGSGKNYLLLIGVNSYTYWNRLHNAVKDCNDISTTLTTYYQFDKSNVITLFNEEATRENILETFETLQETLSEDDNLLIYYAGHGFYDPQSTLGYWVPVNARLNKIPDFIRNSTIHDYLRTINSKHTLLIADACYAGTLFANSRGTVNEKYRSRWAFTSGDIEKVWDGQPGQNSPFARYLIRFLRSNTKDKLQADELIDNVKQVVERNTAQTPKGAPLKSVGDENGIFVFYRRK